MKAFCSLMTVLVCGAVMALMAQQFVSFPAVAVPAQPFVAAVAASATSGSPGCPGDINGDNAVNSADLSILLANFGTICAPDNDGDGWPADQDCDDNDPGIQPGATQPCATGFPGACSMGLRTCQLDGTWTSCAPGITPGSQTEICNNIDDDCDGSIDEGNPCPARPNAFNNCFSGNCVMSCQPGFSNCDGNDTNGCEINHVLPVNTCGSAEFLGTYCGDLQCVALCGGSDPFNAAIRTGNRAKWFRVRMDECSGCSGNLSHTIRLVSPSGINYDLYIHAPCGTVVGSATNPSGTLDSVTYTRSRTSGDDAADYWIEVRYQSGASCSNWTLTLEARNCS